MMSSTKTEIRQTHVRYLINYQHVLMVSLICNIIIFILMTVCLMSSYWITAEGFRQGLLYLCIEELDSNSKFQYEQLPFDLAKEQLEPGCYPNRDKLYLKFCTFLCLITQLSALASALLTGFALKLKGLKKMSSLRFAASTSLLTLFCDLALIITYPTQFSQELDKSNRNLWELNGAFGLACGSAILATGTVILILLAIYKYAKSQEIGPTRI